MFAQFVVKNMSFTHLTGLLLSLISSVSQTVAPGGVCRVRTRLSSGYICYLRLGCRIWQPWKCIPGKACLYLLLQQCVEKQQCDHLAIMTQKP